MSDDTEEPPTQESPPARGGGVATRAEPEWVWERPAARARLLFHLQAIVRFLLAWLPLSSALGGLVAAGTTGAAGAAVGCAVAFVGFLQAIWWPSLSFDRYAWCLRETELVVASGVVFRSIVGIPLTRIQHVDLRQGPLELLLGLAHLQIHTASGLGADGQVPGMELATAEHLRERLMHVAGGDDGV